MWWKIVSTFAIVLLRSAASSESEGSVEQSIQIMVKPTIYYVGDKKAIYCKGKNLEEDIHWFTPAGKQVHRRMTNNTRLFVEDKKDPKAFVPLMIQYAKTEDNGNWTCRSGDLLDSLVLYVGDKANITIVNEIVEALEGSNVKFDCHAKGFPRPEIQWYLDMLPIKENNEKFSFSKSENNVILNIKNISHMDAGEYKCRATQESLTFFEEKPAILVVKHKPVMEFTSTKEIYAILNETKIIMCKSIANPAPDYKWVKRDMETGYDNVIKDGVFIAENRSYSTLELRMYNKSNLGEYICTAKNVHGRESVVFHVGIGNKPNPPDEVICIHSSANELIFNVSCTNCSITTGDDIVSEQPDNLNILGYSFQLVPVVPEYTVPDWDMATEYLVDIVDPENITFPIGPLTNSTKYYVRVRTRNDAGFSSWLDVKPNPSTTNYAEATLASLTLVIALLFINWFK